MPFTSKSLPYLFFIFFLTSPRCSAFFYPQTVKTETQIEHPLLVKAERFYQHRQFEKAINICIAALRELKPDTNTENYIIAKNLLGTCYIYTRSFNKAFSAINEGLITSNIYFPPDHYLIGEIYYSLGVYYERTGHPEECIKSHQKALDILVRNFGQNHLKVAEVFIGLGEVYMRLIADLKIASGYFQRSVKIREIQLPADHLDLYVSYFYMAQVYKRLGDNDKALAYAFKALSVINSRKEYRAYFERCYTLLGDIYYSQADFIQAIDILGKGIFHSIEDNGPVNYNLIKKYTHLGAAYGEINQNASAISCFKKSLDIHRQHHHHDGALKAENFLHLGRIFLKLGTFDSTKYYLKEYLNLQLSDYGQSHIKSSEAYGFLAKHFQKVKSMDSATFYMQKALIAAVSNFTESDIIINPTLQSLTDHPQLFKLFADKGSILLDLFISNPDNLNNLTSALKCFKIADTLMLLSKNSYQQEGSKLFFADHYHHIYEKALQTSYLPFEKTKDPTYAADAFSFMEKSKAFLLAESLHKAEIFTQAGLPDSIREIERSLNSALVAYRSQLENNNQKPNTEEIQQRIQSQIFEISQKQERLLDTIARLYPNYFQIKYQKLSTLQDIQQFAKKNNSTIIEYFWGEERIYVLGISGRRTMLHFKHFLPTPTAFTIP